MTTVLPVRPTVARYEVNSASLHGWVWFIGTRKVDVIELDRTMPAAGSSASPSPWHGIRLLFQEPPGGLDAASDADRLIAAGRGSGSGGAQPVMPPRASSRHGPKS